MSGDMPERIPDCAINLLARQEWFLDPEVLKRTRLAKANWFARFLSSERFSGGGIEAITLRRTIYIRKPDVYDPHTPKGLALLAHETKHVEQYEQDGMFRFFFKYLRSYRSGGYGESISFEEQAYQLQRQVKAHLEKEFAANSGRSPCQEMGSPHTPNDEFAKTTPEKFYLAV